MVGRQQAEKGQSYESRRDSIIEKIEFLYNDKNDLGIKNLIKRQPINILVDALETIGDIDIIIRFLVLSHKVKMGSLFLSLSEDNRLKILNTIKTGILSLLLADLNSDDIYEIFTDSPPSIQKKIIFNASKELKEEIKQLKSFDFAQAGSIMNTTFINLVEGMHVYEAINYLRINNEEYDIGEEVFVVDSDEKIVGTVKTKNLLFTDDDFSIAEITEKSFISIRVDDDIDEVIDLFKKYSVNSVAVVDSKDQLVGIINYQDVIPEILDNNIEDVYKFYGIRETKRSYLGSTVWEIVKSRIFFLILMLFAATFTTFAIDKFESMGVFYTAGISSAILVPIIPIITDTCGNTGSQTAATIIQAASAGELKNSDFWSVIKKEFKISLVIGGILAFCNFWRLTIYFACISIDTDKFYAGTDASLMLTSFSDTFVPILGSVKDKLTSGALYKIGLVGALSSSLSLWIVVILSKFFGTIIPFVAIKLDWDPSSVSSPVLTTILDTVSSIIFFGLGVFLLHMAISPIFGLTVSGGKLVAASS